MSAAAKMTPQDEMAELLGITVEPEPADESPPGVVEEDAPAPDPEPAAEDDAPIAAEAETPAEDEPTPDPDPVEQSTRSKREKALLAELTKLRREVRTREQQDSMRFAPAPTTSQLPVEQH